MTTSDRPVLVRCTIVLSVMAWTIPAAVLLMVYSLLSWPPVILVHDLIYLSVIRGLRIRNLRLQMLLLV